MYPYRLYRNPLKKQVLVVQCRVEGYRVYDVGFGFSMSGAQDFEFGV